MTVFAHSFLNGAILSFLTFQLKGVPLFWNEPDSQPVLRGKSCSREVNFFSSWVVVIFVCVCVCVRDPYRAQVVSSQRDQRQAPACAGKRCQESKRFNPFGSCTINKYSPIADTLRARKNDLVETCLLLRVSDLSIRSLLGLLLQHFGISSCTTPTPVKAGIKHSLALVDKRWAPGPTVLFQPSACNRCQTSTAAPDA